MSETVYYRGTLTEVKRLENETLEEQCKRLINYNESLPLYCNSYKELLLNACYEQYFIYQDKLYSIDKTSVDLDDDIFKANLREDGKIEFEVKYYNGGCCLDEALEEAVKDVYK